MNYSIRPFQEPDRQAVKELWRICGLSTPYNDPDEDLNRFLRFDNARVLVATAPGSTGSTARDLAERDPAQKKQTEERLAGTACLCHDAHRGYVYYLAVCPDCQGGGIGARLMERAERWTQEQGLIKMHIFVRDTNLPVKAFYERLGYGQQGVALMTKFFKTEAA